MSCSIRSAVGDNARVPVTVNDVAIAHDQISREAQYHPAAKPIDAWLSTFAWFKEYASLRLLGLFAVVTLLHILVSFPVSFTSGYRLEHKFKLSTLSNEASGCSGTSPTMRRSSSRCAAPTSAARS